MKKTKENISKLTIVFIIISILATILINKTWTKNNKVITSDIIHYYAYLPATFIYKDLSLKFTENYKGEHKFIIWSKKNDEGNRVIKTTMGMSILYSPFFFLGHISARFLDYDMGGYSNPYKFWLLLGSVFYLFIGLLFLRKILLKYFSDIVTAITIIAIVLGTNLFHYSTYEATMPHSYNFAFFIFFIFLSIKWHEKPNIKYSIIIGITIGIITLIRPTNIIVALFFVLWQVSSFKSLKSNFNLFLQKYYLIILIILFAIIVMIPQIIYWYKISGHFFYYSYGANESFFFSNPQLIKGLFGYRKGWFLYTPMMVFAIIGLIFLRRDKQLKHFLVPITIFLFFNIYILLSWWSWWYGGGFGLRAFIESYALLSISLAAFIKWVLTKKRIVKLPIITFVFILILHNLFQTAQYYYRSIHWDSMSKASYWDSFGRLYRSSNFVNLLETPDYLKAQKGIQAIIIKDKKTYNFKEVYCNAEFFSEDSTMLMSIDNIFKFTGVNNISKDFAFSGENSVKVNKKNQDAFCFFIENPKPKEVYYCTVKRLGKNNFSFLVASDNASDFYKSNSISTKISNNSKWEIIKLYFKVPDNFKKNKIKIYIWNSNKKNVYFDDLKISKQSIK